MSIVSLPGVVAQTSHRAVLGARRRAADPRRQLAALGPLEQVRAGRLWRRIPQLVLGLALYATSMVLLLRATLGVMPWDVLHQGVARNVPWSFGTIVIVTSVLVLLLWIPLRQQPGLGTVLNAVLIGVVADLLLPVVGAPETWLGRGSLMAAGIVLNGLATAMYIGSQLGPGPRDGLMTGLARRTGRSIRLIRTSIEVTVVAVGWLLGGVVGIGTLLYALTIGPITQALLPWFTVELPRADPGGEPRPR